MTLEGDFSSSTSFFIYVFGNKKHTILLFRFSLLVRNMCGWLLQRVFHFNIKNFITFCRRHAIGSSVEAWISRVRKTMVC